MQSQKHLVRTFVAKDTNNLTYGALINDYSDMADGQIAVIDNDNKTVGISAATNTITGKTVVRLVCRRGTELFYSPFITKATVAAKIVETAAAVEQVTYIGYNGASGSIDTTTSNEFFIKVIDQSTIDSDRINRWTAQYVSKASTSEATISQNLTWSLLENMNKTIGSYPKTMFKISRINSNALVSANDFVNGIKVVNGYNVIVGAAKITLTGTSGTANVTGIGGLTKLATFDTNLTTTATNFVTAHAAAYLAVGVTLTSSTTSLIFTPTTAYDYLADPVITNATTDLAGTVFTAFEYTTNTDAVVGDYIRLGATTTTACALTSSVYKITALSGNKITLDIPIVEATGTYAAGSAYHEVIPAATADAADFGIKIQGISRFTYDTYRPGYTRYYKNKFIVGLENFTNTVVTYTTAGYDGIGQYYQVAEMEWFDYGHQGKYLRVGNPSPEFSLNATSGKSYDCISFTDVIKHTSIVSGDADAPFTIHLYLPSDSTNAYDNDKTVQMIEDWLSITLKDYS